MGDYVGQAVADARNDMGSVQAAAGAISAAISKCEQYMNAGTWSGPAATSWQADWTGFYKTVQGLLNDLPSAEASVISAVQAQAEAQLKKDPELNRIPTPY